METYLIDDGDWRTVTHWVCPEGVPGSTAHNVTHHLVRNRAEMGVLKCVYCRRTEGDLRAEQTAIHRRITERVEATMTNTRTTSIVVTTDIPAHSGGAHAHNEVLREVVEKLAANAAYFGQVPEEGTGNLFHQGVASGTFTIVTTTTE